jgi:hypothetical protein
MKCVGQAYQVALIVKRIRLMIRKGRLGVSPAVLIVIVTKGRIHANV